MVTKRLLGMINNRRVSGGHCGEEIYSPSNPLRWNNRLAQAAFVHASEMAESGRLSHRGGDGRNPGERIRSAGYKWRAYGENIGEGYKGAEDMFNAWIKSKGHCKNIMAPLFKDVGAARIVKGDRIYWVLVFGTPY